MAFPARERDPLFDGDTAALLERRGRELIGLALIAVAVLTAMLLASYSPDDPSWLSATDRPAGNLLGRPGASIAAPLFMIAGYGAWSIVLILGTWGARFVTHHGNERAIGCLTFAPIAVALASVYIATHAVPAGWPHSFGLGGLFGETVLGAILSLVPISAALGVKILSAIVFFGAIALTAFVLGFTRPEISAFARFLLRGLIYAYAVIVALLRATLRLFGRGVVAAHGAYADSREARRERLEAETPLYEEEEPKPSLLSRIRQRAPEPQPEIEEPYSTEPSDRVKAKIASVIRAKGHATEPAPLDRSAEPPVRRADEQPWPEFNAFDPDLDMPEPELIDEPFPAAPAMFETARGGTPDPKAVVQHSTKRAAPSKRARAEAQPMLNFGDRDSEYEVPPLSLLEAPSATPRQHLSDEALEENARMLENVLDDYGVKGDIVSVRPGPVVTMYELEPAPGLKASRVIGLADDIARSMSALSARVSTVPGRSVIGIELPNETREKVLLREILGTREYGDGNSRLPLALGKDIGGGPVVANLAKMPHLLIAGTTGSGKSVAINTMILSLLYKLSPEECRLIMIDPKMLELSVYDGIPHLLSPVVTDPKKAVVALKWVVAEMEERYRKMSKMGVRNIDGYNGRVREALSKGEMFSRTVQTGFDDETGDPVFETEEFAPEAIPYIVVVVDEMADLMMVAGKEIEACIQRLAQMARASGIHLIMATQRPSVDVITGTIKANFPTRISFQVTGKIDSRTILGEQGAEQLLGMGDMLYMAGGAKITRVHGPFVSDEEVEEIVRHLKSWGAPEYVSGVVEGPADDEENAIDAVLGLGGNTDGEDALYDQAVAIVIKDRKCSTSYIQRKLAIGYNKAARLVEQMEDAGLVTPANHVGKREILVPEPQ